MTEKVILSSVELTPEARQKLEEQAGSKGYVLRLEGELDPKEKSEVEILLHIPGKEWVTRERANELTNLKLVQSYSAGVEHINFDALPENVIVCGNVGAFAEPIAEHVFGMILVHARRLFHQNESLKRGQYDHRTDALFLKGKTIGILGAGGIGQAVARLAKCFGMHTLGINTSGRDVEYFDKVGSMDSIDAVLSRSDVVVISLPLSIKTKSLIDRSKLEKMKKDCILVNVARGKIIVEKDLYEHLKNNPSFRAALDVWWKKRPDKEVGFVLDYPFFELPNFIGTPHVSGDVSEAHELACNSLVSNVIRFVEGKPLKGIARREDYVGL